ncbi:hypothetical protein JX266_008265 [Neoarthrinium moseri]|uniref:uncharacterized protein n=1 Tax=Neoarthrinium moseri TaxID=1658444 RepID=UPI001FDDBB98|nr:uncharacterized protein JN550_006199 [Neoarthrinium moseri]KAI1845654.1 hypothetical protein JX266_008265 [Neoarthrinium moseri]KAI1868624.1 hypothetical protein JN550_006199 [Neoarthrinium moseri]
MTTTYVYTTPGHSPQLRTPFGANRANQLFQRIRAEDTRREMYTPTPPPPVPPPKPSSHDTSRLGTPSISQSPRPSPLTDNGFNGAEGKGKGIATDSSGLIPAPSRHDSQRLRQVPQEIPDPGEGWLPKFLEDKSKQDLADILSSPAQLNALTHSPSTAHPSTTNSHANLQFALTENLTLAQHLLDLESHLNHQRSSTQAQLLSTHALERQWRQKQSEMDVALAPFAPASLYTRLTQGLQEQEMVCAAMEESFLDGDGEVASEREALDWVRRYREAKKLYYLRQERKERWNERRVGGWRLLNIGQYLWMAETLAGRRLRNMAAARSVTDIRSDGVYLLLSTRLAESKTRLHHKTMAILPAFLGIHTTEWKWLTRCILRACCPPTPRRELASDGLEVVWCRQIRGSCSRDGLEIRHVAMMRMEL